MVEDMGANRSTLIEEMDKELDRVACDDGTARSHNPLYDRRVETLISRPHTEAAILAARHIRKLILRWSMSGTDFPSNKTRMPLLVR